MTISDTVLDAVAHGEHHAPHDVLGLHQDTDAAGRAVWTIRARRPLAHAVTAVFADGERVRLDHLREGIWAGARAGRPRAYVLETSYPDGSDHTADDPYRHLPTLGELDLHLIREGRHEKLWQVLGAHVREDAGTTGTAFAVWAPDARAVRVVGSFNDWDGRGDAMRSLGASGVWQLFVPSVGAGRPASG